MTYLLVGESSLIEKQIQEILIKEESFSLVKYDFEEISVISVLEELNTLNLFDEKKIVICYHLEKLDNKEELLKYLNNQSNNILVLTTTITLNQKDKFVKELLSHTKYIELNSNDLFSYIKASFEGYSISTMATSLLKDYCNNDYHKLENEIEKLKMYKLDDKIITIEDIKLIVKKSLDKNIFNLLDAVSKKNKKEIFSIFYELINNKEDEGKIIASLANNYKLIFKVKGLTVDNSDDECIKILSMHPYRFKLLKEKTYNYTNDELLNYIKMLGNLDISIKTGKVDKRSGLELFFAKI